MARQRSILGAAIALWGLLQACSEPRPATHTKESNKTSSKLPTGAAGAGSQSSAYVGTPGEDLSFEMKGHVDAGGELQNCVLIQLPIDRGRIAVHSAESHYTPGSHHFLVYRVGHQPPGPDDGTEHLCSPMEEAGNFGPTYYEAQAPDSHRDLPAGVAHVFEPGEVLLLTSHYLNTTASDLDTSVTFTLHTIDIAKVEQEAGSIFFYNAAISIPPFSTVTVTRSCPLTADFHPALLWSHMHSHGIDFSATTDDESADGVDGPLYETRQWSEPTPREFPYDPAITLHAGSSITYSCTYKNSTADMIVQGLSAKTNEMCILHGMYWPRTDQVTEECYGGTSTASDPIPAAEQEP